MTNTAAVLLIGPIMFSAVVAIPAPGDDKPAVTLFPKDGRPAGWVVRQWDDVAKPVEGADWTVKHGVLSPGQKRGTWLMSEKEYGDLALEFEIKLTERGNSGVALRAPMKGDPAFDGLELQIADVRYNPAAKPNELTGAIYRALAPTKQVYKPADWNHFQIELKGTHLKVVLNGETIQDTDISRYPEAPKRHDGSDAPLLKDRPRRGHIGFQHLSRDHEPILIRNVKLKELD
jgi:hypothetical protein